MVSSYALIRAGKTEGLFRMNTDRVLLKKNAFFILGKMSEHIGTSGHNSNSIKVVTEKDSNYSQVKVLNTILEDTTYQRYEAL